MAVFEYRDSRTHAIVVDVIGNKIVVDFNTRLSFDDFLNRLNREDTPVLEIKKKDKTPFIRRVAVLQLIKTNNQGEIDSDISRFYRILTSDELVESSGSTESSFTSLSSISLSSITSETSSLSSDSSISSDSSVTSLTSSDTSISSTTSSQSTGSSESSISTLSNSSISTDKSLSSSTTSSESSISTISNSSESSAQSISSLSSITSSSISSLSLFSNSSQSTQSISSQSSQSNESISSQSTNSSSSISSESSISSQSSNSSSISTLTSESTSPSSASSFTSESSLSSISSLSSVSSLSSDSTPTSASSLSIDDVNFAHKAAITFNSQISGTHTDFPVLITEDLLPSEMLDADGSIPAQNDGGDIRFSSDIDGNNRLSVELVSISLNNNPSLSTAEIWVKVPTLTDGTTIYVWWRPSSPQQQPPVDAPFGSRSVWSDYVLVYHGGDDRINAVNGDVGGSSSEGYATQLVGSAVDATDGDGGVVSWNQSHGGVANFTIQVLTRPTSLAGTFQRFCRVGGGVDGSLRKNDSNNNYEAFLTIGGAVRVIDTSSAFAINTDYHLAGTYNGTDFIAYKDGVNVGSLTVAGSTVNSGTLLQIGRTGSELPFAFVDEMRVAHVTRNADWLLTEYRNFLNPSSVGSVGPILGESSSTQLSSSSSTDISSQSTDLSSSTSISSFSSSPSSISDQPGTLVAVGGGSSQTQLAWSNDDGVTWTSSSFDFLGQLRCSAHNPITDITMVGGVGDGTDRLWRSPGGDVWFRIQHPGGLPVGIAVNNSSRWVLMGSGSDDFYYSDDDGDNWTQCSGTMFSGTVSERAMRFVGGWFVAVGTDTSGSTTEIRVSSDGITFSEATGTLGAHWPHDVVHDSGTWLAVGLLRYIARSLTTPETGWNIELSNISANDWIRFAAKFGSTWYAFGGSDDGTKAQNGYFTSTNDGDTWSGPTGSIFSTSDRVYRGVELPTGRVVLGGYQGGILTTDTGNTFTSRTSPFTDQIRDFAVVSNLRDSSSSTLSSASTLSSISSSTNSSSSESNQSTSSSLSSLSTDLSDSSQSQVQASTFTFDVSAEPTQEDGTAAPSLNNSDGSGTLDTEIGDPLYKINVFPNGQPGIEYIGTDRSRGNSLGDLSNPSQGYTMTLVYKPTGTGRLLSSIFKNISGSGWGDVDFGIGVLDDSFQGTPVDTSGSGVTTIFANVTQLNIPAVITLRTDGSGNFRGLFNNLSPATGTSNSPVMDSDDIFYLGRWPAVLAPNCIVGYIRFWSSLLTDAEMDQVHEELLSTFGIGDASSASESTDVSSDSTPSSESTDISSISTPSSQSTVSSLSSSSGSSISSESSSISSVSRSISSSSSANIPLAWDPATTPSGNTLSNENRTVLVAHNHLDEPTELSDVNVTGSGKYYWEVTFESGNFHGIGISNGVDQIRIGTNANGYAYLWDGRKHHNGATAAYGPSIQTPGDIISVLLDLDSAEISFWVNGVDQGVAYSSINTSSNWYAAVAHYDGSSDPTLTIEGDPSKFTYTPPNGYDALGTNLDSNSSTSSSQSSNLTSSSSSSESSISSESSSITSISSNSSSSNIPSSSSSSSSQPTGPAGPLELPNVNLHGDAEPKFYGYFDHRNHVTFVLDKQDSLMFALPITRDGSSLSAGSETQIPSGAFFDDAVRLSPTRFLYLHGQSSNVNIVVVDFVSPGNIVVSQNYSQSLADKSGNIRGIRVNDTTAIIFAGQESIFPEPSSNTVVYKVIMDGSTPIITEIETFEGNIVSSVNHFVAIVEQTGSSTIITKVAGVDNNTNMRILEIVFNTSTKETTVNQDFASLSAGIYRYRLARITDNRFATVSLSSPRELALFTLSGTNISFNTYAIPEDPTAAFHMASPELSSSRLFLCARHNPSNQVLDIYKIDTSGDIAIFEEIVRYYTCTGASAVLHAFPYPDSQSIMVAYGAASNCQRIAIVHEDDIDESLSSFSTSSSSNTPSSNSSSNTSRSQSSISSSSNSPSSSSSSSTSRSQSSSSDQTSSTSSDQSSSSSP